MKVLLSYPRSGNHLMRFMIELLTNMPTYGVDTTENELCLFENKYPETVPFDISCNIKDPDIIASCYHKRHIAPETSCDVGELIFIVRNPRECFIRQCGYYTWNADYNWFSYEAYFRLIDYYLQCPGKKIMFFYEDMLTNRTKFVMDLYTFLGVHDSEKIKYVLENIDWLYDMCKKGEGRCWAGIKSNDSLNFYYPNISDKIKERFDEFIENKVTQPKFAFLRDKYGL